MKSLQALLAAFALSALPALGQLVEDPETGLRTGTITVNGQTYTIGRRQPLSGANLSRADLRRADLRDASLREADLSGANLWNANLSGANLSGANLTGVNLEGANLEKADLEGANLEGTDFSGIDLSGVRSGNITGTPSALPVGWRFIRGYLIGPHADLSGSDLNHLNLSDVDLSEAHLSGANLEGTDLSGADLRGVRAVQTTGTPSALPVDWFLIIVSGDNGGGDEWSERTLVGPHANIYMVNLEGTDLSGANLEGINLDGANLSGANLSGANLDGANLNGAALNGTDLTGASLRDLITPSLEISNFVQIQALQNSQIHAGGISPEQAAAIETNTAKVGITAEQATSIQSNTAEISELKTMVEVMSVQLAQINTQIGDLQGAVAQKDATIENLQGDLATAIAERDARFTEDQIRALSADYTIGLNAAGNVQMKINLFESADLSTFAPLTLSPESVSVVDGSICLEFARADDAAFFRFSVQ